MMNECCSFVSHARLNARAAKHSLCLPSRFAASPLVHVIVCVTQIEPNGEPARRLLAGYCGLETKPTSIMHTANSRKVFGIEHKSARGEY